MEKRLARIMLLLSILAACSPAPPPPVEGLNAFTGFRLIDGRGGNPVDKATMVVRDGRIEAIGALAEVQIPPGATEIDLKGRIVTPGLIVTHGHVGLARGLESGPQVNTPENVMDQLKRTPAMGSLRSSVWAATGTPESRSRTSRRNLASIMQDST